MGILFLAAGYFAQGSLARRGPAGFVRERLMRLGAPTLFYMLVLNPVILLLINPNRSDYGPLPGAYASYLTSGNFLGGTGPMWFAAALLIFSAVLAAWWALRPLPEPAAADAPRAPRRACDRDLGPRARGGDLRHPDRGAGRLVGPQHAALLLPPVRPRVRDRGRGSAGPLAPGACTVRSRAQGRMGRPVLGPVALALVLVMMGALTGKISRDFAGGWNSTALAFAGWEQLAGLGLGLGALAFCSGRLDVSTPLSRWLSDRSFGVYLFHPPILILITIAMRPITADPFFKVALLTAACLVASFLVSDVARRIPGLRALV